MIIKPKYYGPSIPSTYAVNMTAAASGSNGITVADDDDIDFGTGDFFLHWEGSLPDWTPASDLFLIYKYQDASNYYALRVNGSSYTVQIVVISGGVNIFPSLASTSAVSVADGVAKITAVCSRESASVAGSISYYVAGSQLGSARSVTARTPPDISNSGSFYMSGTNTTRIASNTISCIVGNFAPTAAEVLDLCTNGIPESWKWGSQANMVTNGDFPTNTTGWTATAGASATVVSGECQITTSGSPGQGIWQAKSFVAGKRYRISGDIRIVSGTGTASIRAINNVFEIIGQSADISAGTATKVSFDFTMGAATRVYLRGSDSGAVYGFDNITCVQIGATMALLPISIPTSGATAWDDSSGNTGGGTLPAAGATKVTIRK